MNIDDAELAQLLLHLNLEIYRRDKEIAALKNTVMSIMFPPNDTVFTREQDERLDATFERRSV